MMLRQPTTWRKEVLLWALCLTLALLLGGPLILWSAGSARLQSRVLADTTGLTPPLAGEEPSPPVSELPEVLGQARLDLAALAEAFSVDDADNVRWALVRRTPTAAQVYRPEEGVDWAALRRVSQTGTILVPAGFAWSFNETFQQGPGYKEAGGILAGGHCALATLFRAAAVRAGLPVTSRPHARPIPGFSLEETVNILWGRDDLVVRNPTDRDLYFLWRVTSEAVEVSVVPVTPALPLPPLPDWRGATVAMVYGRPGPGGWGSLGQTVIADHALYLARTFAGRVDGWNGEKPVVVAVNPNVAMAGRVMERELYLDYLIAEARRQGYYVMLDVQTGEEDPLSLFEGLMDRFLQENVWFDWDLEHTAGGVVDAEAINRVAAAYFARREARGYTTPGIFAFYVFKEDQVTNPAALRRRYPGGAVIPIFDGYGGRDPNPARDKIAKTARVLALFGEGPFGIMEFETRWGTRYDRIPARDYFAAYPDAQIVVSQ